MHKLVNKEDYGLAGGISVNHRDPCRLLQVLCRVHKKRNPNIKLINIYVGEKRNVNQDRNYLYHISRSQILFESCPQKFTLVQLGT